MCTGHLNARFFYYYAPLEENADSWIKVWKPQEGKLLAKYRAMTARTKKNKKGEKRKKKTIKNIASNFQEAEGCRTCYKLFHNMK